MALKHTFTVGSPLSTPRTPERRLLLTVSSPRDSGVRQTVRGAANELMAALRKTTAMVDMSTLTVDEMLQLGARAILGLHEELAQRRMDAEQLREEVNAAYQASAATQAQDALSARHAVEESEARAAAVREATQAREREALSTVQQLRHALERSERDQQEMLRAVDRTAAHARLMEQKFDKARAAAARILKALPPSAAEAAREAEQLTRVAAGEQMHEPEDVDVMLARALERAMRLAEKTVASTAEAAILRSETEAERARYAGGRQREKLLVEQLQLADSERQALRLECLEAHAAREAADQAAEEATRRFQEMLVMQRTGSLPPRPRSPQQRPQSPPSLRDVGTSFGSMSSSPRWSVADAIASLNAPRTPASSPRSFAAGAPHAGTSFLLPQPMRTSPGAQAGHASPTCSQLVPATPLFLTGSTQLHGTDAAADALSTLERAVLETAKFTALLGRGTS